MRNILILAMALMVGGCTSQFKAEMEEMDSGTKRTAEIVKSREAARKAMIKAEEEAQIKNQ